MIEQPPPWEGFDPQQACWIHHRNEPITRRTFIACYECGHVWTRYRLQQAWRKALREMEGWRVLLHPRRYLRRARNIFFCQECIHDF